LSCYYVPDIPAVLASINIKVMLEGFYDASQSNMHTNLLNSALIQRNTSR